MRPDSTLCDQLAKTRDILSKSKRVAAFSGAGLSAESGLSTFRDPDPDALWSRFDPTELASIQGFEANPEMVLDWYQWRRDILAGVQPNAAHRALANQTRIIQITQNVDNLLEQAGIAAEQVLHLHGSIVHDRCHSSDCDYHERIDREVSPPQHACPQCGDRLRPAVVWFGESLPQETWMQAQQLCMSLDCLLVIGTSATVYPAAGLITLARQNSSKVIIVNPDTSVAGGEADVYLAAPAADILPVLLEGFDLGS